MPKYFRHGSRGYVRVLVLGFKVRSTDVEQSLWLARRQGRKVIVEATRQRMASGKRKRVLEGFYVWFEDMGREMLSRLAKVRERRKRWRRLMLE